MSTPTDELEWLVEPAHTALLVIDVQNDFVDLVPSAREMLTRLLPLVDEARRVGVMVIRVRALQNDETDSEVWLSTYKRYPAFRNLARPSTGPTGEQGFDYHPDFRPQPGDLEIIKHRYSAFIGTNLDILLRRRGIRTVIVTGLTTTTCVASTARDAFQRDLYTIMVEDGCATRSQALHEAMLEAHRLVFGVVSSTTEIIQAWRRAQTPDRPLAAAQSTSAVI